MVRITRVYTRTGDSGETALVGGTRVAKDSLRIEAYGTIDELNSIVGLARVFNEERLKKGSTLRPRPEEDSARRLRRERSAERLTSKGKAHRFLDEILRKIQDELLDLGSELATPPDFSYEGMYHVGEKEVKRIEELIDECLRDLGPLKSFVLPGGGRIGGYLHQCRTVCRRAEREIFRLSRAEEIGAGPLKYVNRLSDLFFVLSRWVGRHTGEKEYLWQRGLKKRDKGP